MKKLIAPMLSLGTAMVLVACGSAPTRLYSLQPVAPRAAQMPYDGPPVRVAAVHFPAEMDRTEIVTTLQDGQLRIHDLDQWAAPLAKMAQQTLSADLVERLPAGKVAFPHLPPPAPVAELRVDILQINSGAEERLKANWQLTLEHRAGHSGVVDLQGNSWRGGANEVATGLSALLGRLADEIVGALPDAVAAPNSNP